jgi:hypothetical protein
VNRSHSNGSAFNWYELNKNSIHPLYCSNYNRTLVDYPSFYKWKRKSIKTYYERYSATAWLPHSKIKADEDTRAVLQNTKRR